MCGLTGFVTRGSDRNEEALSSVVSSMNARLVHRGPDDSGFWCDESNGVALAQRRLSIVDLSPMGHQPMASASGRYVLVYNGEVYNFPELRRDLEQRGASFRGHSDTEVILGAIEEYGVRSTLERLVGMFAFSLWDRQTRTLTLARDQLGIKPLYWAQANGLFLFGSELKALRAHPDWHPQVDRNAIAAFMRHGYIPAPHTIFRGAQKLMPGTMLTLKPGAEPDIEPYWTVQAAPQQHRFASDGEAIDQLESLLMDAVGRQMLADVPLGAFLSGGIDSSVVVALMQAQSDRPVKTFSIGFHEDGFNEAQHAEAVAKHLGTDHTELYVTPEQALSVVPNLTEWYDEPFADSSQVPTYLVSKLTREHVTVALSGDGGDENFGGYNRYAYGVELWNRSNRVPMPVRQAAKFGITQLPTSFWDACGRLIPASRRPGQFGHKLHKLAHALTQDTPDEIYRRLISQWQEPEKVVIDAREPKGVLWDEGLAAKIPDFFSRMQYLDLLTYLPDDILTKVDRASMAVSLETRVPLLDHRVVEFARRLPHHMKVRNEPGSAMQGKWLLRQVLNRHVPAEIMERPKMGFGIPIDMWLRGALREWADDRLSRDSLERVGVLAPEPIGDAWAEHASGRQNLQYPIWSAIILQDWMIRNGISA